MKMNWKVRAKNPHFWIQIALAFITPVLAFTGLTGSDFTTWSMVGNTILSAVSSPYVVSLVAVSVWNALQDPTTAGISDCSETMNCISPKKPQK